MNDELAWEPMHGRPGKIGRQALIAYATGATYVILDMREENIPVKLYAMNPFSDLCPINTDRAMLYREFPSVHEAKDVAAQWETGFNNLIDGILKVMK